MDNKDSFLTIRYKNFAIHTCQNRTTGKEEVCWQAWDHRTTPAKSVHAAKIAITKRLANPPGKSTK
jgi:hypothetical protein